MDGRAHCQPGRGDRGNPGHNQIRQIPTLLRIPLHDWERIEQVTSRGHLAQPGHIPGVLEIVIPGRAQQHEVGS
jgi:hypothetical protein